MKSIKIILLLFVFLCVGGCSNSSKNDLNTEMVSSVGDKYSFTALDLENEELLKANVIVYNKNYSSFLGVKYKQYNSYGSGFIYEEDENYYYLLTNNHVVSYDYSFNNHKIIVEDYFNNKYDGEVINTSSKYDLAVVRINKKVELNVLDIVSEDATIGENVKAMSNPSSLKNIISEGKINCYSIINLNTNKSNVNFDVLVHSADIMKGSSGSALLNSNNEVIGVTFAGVFDNNGEFVTGYSIPASRINEFLGN